jgi:tetratricopeptide (TPR) repeat protein
MCLAASVALGQDPAKLAANPVAQTVFYTGNVKIIPPAGWAEKQLWELDDPQRFIPLYNRQVQGVAFIRGFDKKAELAEYRGAREPEYVKNLAHPADKLGDHLWALTIGWSAEASRFRLMVGRVSVSQRGEKVSWGPSLNPGRARYLGWIRTALGQVEVIEWVSKSSLDQKSLANFALPSEFAGRKAQILYGEGVFASAAAAYMVVAARFVSPAKNSENSEWIETVLEGITPVPDLEKIAAANQVRIRATIQEALSTSQKKNYAMALEQLQEALTLGPDDANALNLQGGILVEQGKNAEALQILRKAIATNPDHEGAHFNLARALWNQGKKEEAIQEFEIVRRISPLFPQINETLTK